MIFYDKKNTLNVIGLFIFFVIVLGGSFAYFSNIYEGNESASNIELKTANINLNFIDGPSVNIADFTPGQTIDKTFRVENNNNSDYVYSVVWTNVLNGFSSENGLKYSIACISYSDYANKITSSAPCAGQTNICRPNTNASAQGIIDGNIIPANQVQEYTITFNVLNSLPSNTISSFSGTLGIVGGNLAPNTISCDI